MNRANRISYLLEADEPSIKLTNARGKEVANILHAFVGALRNAKITLPSIGSPKLTSAVRAALLDAGVSADIATVVVREFKKPRMKKRSKFDE
jgi:hypothetical protein